MDIKSTTHLNSIKLFNIMKRELMILVMSIFLMSFVVAQVGAADGTGALHDEVVAAGGQEGNPTLGEGIGAKVMAGNYIGENGQQIMIQQQAENQIQLRVNDVSANCGLDLIQRQVENKTQLETQLSNGRNVEIKIMPDVASVTALQRLRLMNCDGECQIELREVGQGEQIKLAYELKTQRNSKVFGLFGARMNVQAQVDAESGELIRIQKPWWAFLASESEE